MPDFCGFAGDFLKKKVPYEKKSEQVGNESFLIQVNKTTHLDVIRVPFELHELGAGPGVPHTQHLLCRSADYHGAWNNQQEFLH